MRRKKKEQNSVTPTLASVKAEMAVPRIARSARIAELNRDTTRLADLPSTTISGTVEKVIPSQTAKKSEKAQIKVEGPEKKYRKLRIENTLTNEHGDDVSLKKGAHVEVTVTSKS
jgi:hypothetical protein